MHIAIAGNIGSGKTTLTGMLAKHFNWEPHYESVDDNPYLASFYEDMQRWSLIFRSIFSIADSDRFMKSASKQGYYSGSDYLRRCSHLCAQSSSNGIDGFP